MVISCQISKELPDPTVPAFPQSYTGHWTGDLEIFRDRERVQKIRMSLEISEVNQDTFDWFITYDDGLTKDIRAYGLVISNKDKGQYLIDEKNGIVLDAQLNGNELTSIFKVGSSLLNVTYELGHEEIVFKIDVINMNAHRMTGDTLIGQDSIPRVDVYPLAVVQRAILQRKRGY